LQVSLLFVCKPGGCRHRESSTFQMELTAFSAKREADLSP
jgi:hypothetical protein